jgi:putative membrane protein
VLFWAAVIALAALLIRALVGGGRGEGAAPPRNTALDLREERFARGEIGREEFEERRSVLLASRAGRR